MEYIAPPNMILRKAFIQGLKFSSFAQHLGSFLAKTLYGTSALALEGGQLRQRIAEWSQNTAMCALTEKVVFTDPYTVSENNRWTSPQLDDYAEGIREDEDLHEAITHLKGKFLGSPQALVHADLHSGSVMASEGVTYVIDPEFGFYGPMGFDVGALLANLLLSYFSQAAANGEEYAEWVLSQTVLLHEIFETEFLALWSEAADNGRIGELYKTDAFFNNGESLSSKSQRSSRSGKEPLTPRAALTRAQSRYMSRLWRDTIGFAGAKMIRRIVGIAHVADLDSILDPDARAQCEKRALLFARKLVLASDESGSAAPSSLSDVRGLAEQARETYKLNPDYLYPF
jgi:5-methylthioribose kinase